MVDKTPKVESRVVNTRNALGYKAVERQSLELWQNLDDEMRARLFASIRAQLLYLLTTDPNRWVPTSLSKAGDLTVSFIVDMSTTEDVLHAMDMMTELDLKESLLAIRQDLGRHHVPSEGERA